MNRFLSILLCLFGEGLIIAGFILFSKAETAVMVMNIVVCTIVYMLYFVDVMFPMVNLLRKSEREVGGLGLRWFVTILYTVLAVAAIPVMNSAFDPALAFKLQLLVHCILLFILISGLTASYFAMKQVESVHKREEELRNYLNEMADITRQLMLTAGSSQDIPAATRARIEAMHDNIRFISPSNDPAAAVIEENYIRAAQQIAGAVEGPATDWARVDKLVDRCETLYKERKMIYSKRGR